MPGGRSLGSLPSISNFAVSVFSRSIILIVLWLLGMVSSYTIGGFIHVLLVVAIVMLLIRIINGRRVP